MTAQARLGLTREVPQNMTNDLRPFVQTRPNWRELEAAINDANKVLADIGIESIVYDKLDRKVEVRGPRPEFVLPRDIREVVFIAGGTGIAPALQVAYALSRRALTDATPYGSPVRMQILWSSRTRDDMGENATAAIGSFQDRYASIPGQVEPSDVLWILAAL